MSRLIVVNIVSASYTGSTWLNLLLGAHREAFCVGELVSIVRLGKPVCGMHGPKCPFWSRHDPSGPDSPFHQISQLCGKRILVMKNAEDFDPHLQDPALDVRMIHLVRDGRAVTASIMRKYPEKSAWQAARQWAHEMRRSRRTIDRYGASRAELVRYEDLMIRPEDELRRLTHWLEMKYESSMQTPWTADLHYLGGNRGTLSQLVRKQGLALPADPRESLQAGYSKPNWDLGFYERQDPQSFRDERWQQQLSRWDLRVFAMVAGRLNRQYHYLQGFHAVE